MVMICTPVEVMTELKLNDGKAVTLLLLVVHLRVIPRADLVFSQKSRALQNKTLGTRSLTVKSVCKEPLQ